MSVLFGLMFGIFGMIYLFCGGDNTLVFVTFIGACTVCCVMSSVEMIFDKKWKSMHNLSELANNISKSLKKMEDKKNE